MEGHQSALINLQLRNQVLLIFSRLRGLDSEEKTAGFLTWTSHFLPKHMWVSFSCEGCLHQTFKRYEIWHDLEASTVGTVDTHTNTHTRRTNFAVDLRESFYRVCTNRTAWFRLVWQSQFIKRSLSTSRAECHNIVDLQAWPFFVGAKSSKKSVGNLQICFDSIC